MKTSDDYDKNNDKHRQTVGVRIGSRRRMDGADALAGGRLDRPLAVLALHAVAALALVALTAAMLWG